MTDNSQLPKDRGMMKWARERGRKGQTIRIKIKLTPEHLAKAIKKARINSSRYITKDN
jgi:hypothetical protein